MAISGSSETSLLPIECGKADETAEYLSEKLLLLLGDAVSAAASLPTGISYSVKTSRFANAEAADKVRDLVEQQLGSVLALIDHAGERTVNYERVADSIDKLLQRVQSSLDDEGSKGSSTRPRLFLPELGPLKPALVPTSPPDASDVIPLIAEDRLQDYFAQVKALRWSVHCPAICASSLTKIPRWKPVEQTSLIYVDSIDSLESMVEELVETTAVAIDVEHHSLHSYNGITCLIQLSSRTKDYILDPLAPSFYTEEGKKAVSTQLNRITLNPKIVKVLHGANSDVKWLHNDVDVRILNLFDTCIATKILQQHKQASLAHILQAYCSVTLDKSFQRADWRIRPLPKKMIHYARSDTHYLLYVYDCLRRDLLACADGKNRMGEVEGRSQGVCLKLAEPVSEKDFAKSAALTAARFAVPLAPHNFALLVKLLEWRDKLAANLDEGVASICEARHLVQIAAKEPRSWGDLKNALPKMPKAVYDSAVDILLLVRQQEKTRGQPVQITMFSAVQKMKKGKNIERKSADAFQVSAAGTGKGKEIETLPRVRAAAAAALVTTITPSASTAPGEVHKTSPHRESKKRKRKEPVGKSVVEVLRKASVKKLAPSHISKIRSVISDPPAPKKQRKMTKAT